MKHWLVLGQNKNTQKQKLELQVIINLEYEMLDIEPKNTYKAYIYL